MHTVTPLTKMKLPRTDFIIVSSFHVAEESQQYGRKVHADAVDNLKSTAEHEAERFPRSLSAPILEFLKFAPPQHYRRDVSS